MPATNAIMWNKWLCGFNAKKQLIEKVSILPGDSIERLQTWAPSMGIWVEAFMVQKLIHQMAVTWIVLPCKS